MNPPDITHVGAVIGSTITTAFTTPEAAAAWAATNPETHRVWPVFVEFGPEQVGQRIPTRYQLHPASDPEAGS